jgi:hypothetical protein
VVTKDVETEEVETMIENRLLRIHNRPQNFWDEGLVVVVVVESAFNDLIYTLLRTTAQEFVSHLAGSARFPYVIYMF